MSFLCVEGASGDPLGRVPRCHKEPKLTGTPGAEPNQLHMGTWPLELAYLAYGSWPRPAAHPQGCPRWRRRRRRRQGIAQLDPHTLARVSVARERVGTETS